MCVCEREGLGEGVCVCERERERGWEREREELGERDWYHTHSIVYSSVLWGIFESLYVCMYIHM